MTLVNICGQLSSDCSTIDATGGDIALRNARKAFSSAKPHSEIGDAKDNLRSCLPASASAARRAMIIGHGQPGTIVTGSGPLANDQDKRISVDNCQIWKPILINLVGHITELTLCSCDTGAGQDGANLLMAVANKIGAEASGFTAQIFIDAVGKITCEEPHGVWQHAFPNTDLPPVQAPIHTFGKIVDIKLKYSEGYRTVNIRDVFALSFVDPSKDDKRIFSLEGEAAQEVVRMVDFTEPSEIDGAPLALITGTLKIEYLIQEERDARAFLIYNDRLLFDQSTPNVYYYASPALATALAKFRYESR